MNSLSFTSQDFCFEEGIGREGIVGVDQTQGFGAGGFDHFNIFDRFHGNISDSPLLFAIEFTGTAELEIELGELEAVFSSGEGAKPLYCFVALAFGIEITICLMI